MPHRHQEYNLWPGFASRHCFNLKGHNKGREPSPSSAEALTAAWHVQSIWNEPLFTPRLHQYQHSSMHTLWRPSRDAVPLGSRSQGGFNCSCSQRWSHPSGFSQSLQREEQLSRGERENTQPKGGGHTQQHNYKNWPNILQNTVKGNSTVQHCLPTCCNCYSFKTKCKKKNQPKTKTAWCQYVLCSYCCPSI